MAAALLGIGAALSAFGSVQEGQARSEALENAAAVDRQNAIIAAQQAEFEAVRAGIMGRKQIGAAKAAYAASGVDSNYGSALDVLTQSHANLELDKQNIIRGGQIKSSHYLEQARANERGAANARTGGTLGGIAGLLTAGGRFYSWSQTPNLPGEY